MKRILVVSTTPLFGGGESFVLNTLMSLENSYFIVLCDQLYDRLPHSRVNLFKSSKTIHQISQVKKLVVDLSIDIVILNGGSSLYMAPFIKGVKIVSYRHTTNKYVGNRFRQWIYSVILHITYIFSDSIVHVSDFSKSEQLLFKRKSRTIHNGVEALHRSIDRSQVKQPIRLLHLGRNDRSKGVLDLISVVKRFSKDEVVVDIVGTGELDNYVNSVCNDQIHYHGFQTDIYKYYLNSDIFILMTHFENCPFGIIDAMNSSMPIIATGVGGIPELVENNVNGYLVDSKEELYDAIKSFVNEPSKISNMGEKSREIFNAKFARKKVLTKINDLISSL